MTREVGADGVLDALALRGWVVLRDVVRPGRRRVTLDHVLVGPGGVFVVSRKEWPGPVEIVDGELHLDGRPTPREITQVAESGAAVLALVPDVPVLSVLCLERHEPVTGWVRNVMLCASSNVDEMFTARPAVLGPEQVQQVAGVLTSRLPRAALAASTATRKPASDLVRLPRAVLRAGTLAAAGLLVIGVLQTQLGDQISSVVTGFVTEIVTVGDESKRKPAPVQQLERSSTGRADKVKDRGGRDHARNQGDDRAKNRGKNASDRHGRSNSSRR